ncbi:MAG: hypothetical protein ACFFAI_08235 [Promethearchaeota archaeon]
MSNIYKRTATVEKKINEYITLKLEHGRTYIYVNGKRFIQCIRLILNIPKNDVTLYDEVESIDEAAKLYSTHIHQNLLVRGPGAIRIPNQMHDITPEQEFWGHCSNIQTWVEHDYDTRILMSNISFPLLRELVEAGDPKAKKIFKEEIALRLESGFPSVVQYLLNQRYLGYFTNSEFKTIIESTELIKGLSFKPRMLSQFLIYSVNKFPTLVKDILLQVLKLPEGKKIILLNLTDSEIPRIPYIRNYFTTTPHYFLILKNALENLFIEVDERLGEDVNECILAIEKRLKGQEIDLSEFSGERSLEAIRRLLELEGYGNLGDEERLLLAKKFLGEARRIHSKCAYCGKLIPQGKKICDWCGHKKDDDEGLFTYPFIFKPPDGGGGGRFKEGAIVVPIRI